VIYLASPYSHPDEAVRETRFRQACWHAVRLMREGQLVYSPIVHSHPLAEMGLPGDWPFWAEHDRAMLERCDVLSVLKLPGWTESVGVSAEIGMAEALRIPVRYEEPCGDTETA
jgi:nucleoside 2-deoxyribosyltransferase